MRREILGHILQARAGRQAIAVVTPLDGGAQRIVALADAAGDELAGALEDGFRFDRSSVHRASGGEVFVQIFNPALRLVVIGAVHIAQALVPMARATGYDVIVIDPRGAFATPERFGDVTLHAEWPDEVLPGIGLDRRTAFVALTHDPKIDDPALRAALASPCFYIGALGSRRTQAARHERLVAAGVDEKALLRICGPIGLDIGARGAPEIAVSILAEMTRHLRLGG